MFSAQVICLIKRQAGPAAIAGHAGTIPGAYRKVRGTVQVKAPIYERESPATLIGHEVSTVGVSLRDNNSILFDAGLRDCASSCADCRLEWGRGRFDD